ncbi:MAG: PCMD domain-containing protein, partial [Alistipes sp.]|nr:PCMD domain-containing protein [Alistipes sp.]
FTLTLDENPDEVDDPIVFLPNPQITGGNFDLNDLQRFTGEALVLSIASIGDMQRVRIETEEGFVCEVPATSAEENADGIAVDVADPTNMTVMLGEKFFARFGGGNHVLTITAIDEDGGEGTKTMTVRTQGALSLASTDHWNARGILKAVAFDPEADDVKLGYRKAGDSEWSILPATSEENDIRSVEVSGIHAETEYEYRLFLGDEPVNGLVLTKTGSGPQVYNAGFETWSGSSPLLPYTSDADQWWDTGNHGSSKANTNVTTNEADARPGSAGTTSARLKSQKAAILGIGKFAAGNIFVGKYLGTDGTDGVIGFGKPFPFTYRPRQLKFWYKGTAGKVDYAGGKVSSGDTDVNQVYICLCKMEGPHVVATKRPDTFLDFATNSKTMSYCTSPNGTSSSNDRTDGRIIAWAEWNNTQSQADWTEIVLDLHYNEEYEGEMPTYLMLTASASKYGDYFAGSTSSCIYLDDFELVY